MFVPRLAGQIVPDRLARCGSDDDPLVLSISLCAAKRLLVPSHQSQKHEGRAPVLFDKLR